jgi:hypothetical protein
LMLGKPEQQALVGVSQPPYPADDSIVLQGVRGGRVAVFVVDLRSVFEVGGGRWEVGGGRWEVGGVRCEE